MLAFLATSAGTLVADDPDGKTVFEEKCTLCHSVEAHGISRTATTKTDWQVDLSKAGEKILRSHKGSDTESLKYLISYLKKEIEVRFPEQGFFIEMTHYNKEDDEKEPEKKLEAVAKWVLTLKAK
jgi:hypothetical protein